MAGEYNKTGAEKDFDFVHALLNDYWKNIAINIKNVIIITCCVLAFIGLMFVFTKIKTGEWNLFTKENNIFYTAEAQTEKILCGSILNRSDEEYYVLAYQMQEDNASLYQSIIEKYNSSSRKISLYQLDLSNSRNNICLSDNLSITNDVSTLKLVVPTLLKVKNGQIVSTITNYDQIKNELYTYVD